MIKYIYREENLLEDIKKDKSFEQDKNRSLGLDGSSISKQNMENIPYFFNDYNFIKKFNLQSRRYIGNKAKLADWIFSIIEKETKNINTFIDIFAGTGIIAKNAMNRFENVILNDILYSNNIIYQAFFQNQKWNKLKIVQIANEYNFLEANLLEDNYFSKYFGGKFYEQNIAKIIGYIREDIENRRKKQELNEKEYAILLTSLIYTIDKLANTVGHFDAYIKKPIKKKPLNFCLIQTENFKGAKIYREDANKLARELKGDIAYIDPPYNSRQYSRFYHIYENLVKWEKPKLYGVALKPEPENMSKCCTVKAKDVFKDLVENLDVKYLAVSYNNTYQSKSNFSANKIQLEEIMEILKSVGEIKVFK